MTNEDKKKLDELAVRLKNASDNNPEEVVIIIASDGDTIRGLVRGKQEHIANALSAILLDVPELESCLLAAVLGNKEITKNKKEDIMLKPTGSA
jgi:hypothetical protein